MSTSTHIPTVNDLRVKLCYICREEELYDAEPESDASPPRAWTHPCQCTLVAHEACLLKWIQTSQASASRADNALKCPQCGAKYELVSDNTALLRLLGLGNRALQKLGRGFTAVGFATVVGAVGSGIYFVCTGYGAWAIRQFIGKEMFDAILTEDPSNWPWTAFINLPLIPISLVLSRFQSSSSQMNSIIPTLLFFPPTFPGTPAQRTSLTDLWSKTPLDSRLALALPRISAWPPSPLIFGLFMLPLVRAAYRIAFHKLYFRVMGTFPSARTLQQQGDGLQFNEGLFMIRIRANVEDDGAPAEDRNQPRQAVADAVAAEHQDPAAAAALAAEQVIHADTASLGRRVAGALLIPAISSFMGSLLFRLAQHSRVLRIFLDIHPRPRLKSFFLHPGAGPVMSRAEWAQMGFLKQMSVSAKLVASGWVGSGMWSEGDPVWWRNSVGLGLFFVAKDCIQLLHLYLTKRELESRRVKNRNFAGVDIRELDLIPSFGSSHS